MCVENFIFQQSSPPPLDINGVTGAALAFCFKTNRYKVNLISPMDHTEIDVMLRPTFLVDATPSQRPTTAPGGGGPAGHQSGARSPGLWATGAY